MPQVRNEIYNEEGLVSVEYIEINEPIQDELIAEKEAQLIAIYEELKNLKTQ
jgi:hypothetical protein